MIPPEDLAASFVTVNPCEHGSPCVIFHPPGAEAVLFGPYPNPAIAREKADELRRAVAAAITAGRETTRERRSPEPGRLVSG